jgi:signal transduction histidine kinase
MMIPLWEGFMALLLLSGIGLFWIGIYSYRRWDEPGAGTFAAVAVIFGVGAISGFLVIVTGNADIPESNVPLWIDVGLIAWAVAMVPWFLFALNYTGRKIDFGWRTILTVSVPVSGIGLIVVIRVSDLAGVNVIANLIGTFSLLYIVALAAVGCYLLLRTTYDYGHLSISQGISLAVASIAPLVLVNSTSMMAGETRDLLVFSVFVVAFVLPTAGFSLAMFRYRMFESTPAIGALGERAIPRETDDLIVVVDRDDRIIKINETAAETLADAPSSPLGESFESLISFSVSSLKNSETVELETNTGRRKFDPQVTSFTDQHDRRLGSLLSLREVTERELRKQRLEVLNRVLRHNLRNRIDVIKSNAEAITDATTSDYADTIRDSADELTDLSSAARATDKLLSRQPAASDGDLSEAIRDQIPTDATVAVTIDTPDTASLYTDWEILRSALESAMENAIKHAEESVTVSVEQLSDGYSITVTDDGPGIPDTEVASLKAETETSLQHSTGLDLWQLKWSVTKLNGDLSLDVTDGTTVRIEVPDRSV